MFLLLLGLWQSCGLGRVGVGRSSLRRLGGKRKGNGDTGEKKFLFVKE